MGVAPARDLLGPAIHVDERQERDQPRRRRLEHRHVDAPPRSRLPGRPLLGLLGQRQHHVGVDLVAGLEIDQRHPHQRRRPVGLAGHLHVAGLRLDHRVVARQVGMVRPHRRDPGPDQVGLDRGQGGVIDAELLVARRYGVAAEHVDIELADDAPQRRAARLGLEVECDRLLADVGRDEIGVTVGVGHPAADIAVGIARLRVARRRRGLDPDHAPAEMDEAQRGVGHRQRLLHRQDGPFSQPSPPPSRSRPPRRYPPAAAIVRAARCPADRICCRDGAPGPARRAGRIAGGERMPRAVQEGERPSAVARHGRAGAAP